MRRTGLWVALVCTLLVVVGVLGLESQADQTKRVKNLEVTGTLTAENFEQSSSITALVPTANVKHADYGALGNGSNDDTAEIQAAIDAVAATTYQGVVYFPPGTYVVSATLTLPTNTSATGPGITLQGDGPGASRIECTMVDSTCIKLADQSVSSHHNQFLNLAIVTDADVAGTNTAIDATGMYNLWVNNVEINGFDTYGVYMAQATGGANSLYNKITNSNIICSCPLGSGSCVGTGVYIGHKVNGSSQVTGRRANCASGIHIEDANESFMTHLAIEGNNIGVKLNSTAAARCVSNMLFSNHYENNDGTAAIEIGQSGDAFAPIITEIVGGRWTGNANLNIDDNGTASWIDVPAFASDAAVSSRPIYNSQIARGYEFNRSGNPTGPHWLMNLNDTSANASAGVNYEFVKKGIAYSATQSGTQKYKVGIGALDTRADQGIVLNATESQYSLQLGQNDTFYLQAYRNNGINWNEALMQFDYFHVKDTSNASTGISEGMAKVEISSAGASTTAPYVMPLTWASYDTQLRSIIADTFSGSGVDDLTTGGTYTGTANATFVVTVEDASQSPDTFKWRKDIGNQTGLTTTTIDMDTSAVTLSDGVTVLWTADDAGHVDGDSWTFEARSGRMIAYIGPQVTESLDAATDGSAKIVFGMHTDDPGAYPYTVGSVTCAGTCGAGDDMTPGVTTDGFTGQGRTTIEVTIASEGTPDTFDWTQDGEGGATGVSITGSAQELIDDITITFAGTDNHTAADTHTFRVDGSAPVPRYAMGYDTFEQPLNMLFEGTPDAFETTISVTDPTRDRTVTIPNASGTVVLDHCVGWKSIVLDPDETGTIYASFNHGTAANAAEANVDDTTAPYALTFNKMHVTTGTTVTTGSWVVTLRDDAADTSMTCTIDNSAWRSSDVCTHASIADDVCVGTCAQDDMTSGVTANGYTGAASATYVVTIASGTTFGWTNGTESGADITITGSAQTLIDDVTVTFGNTTGYTTNDTYTFIVTVVASPTVVAGSKIDVSVVGGSTPDATTEMIISMCTAP